jgi:hypothetical protein
MDDDQQERRLTAWRPGTASDSGPAQRHPIGKLFRRTLEELGRGRRAEDNSSADALNQGC